MVFSKFPKIKLNLEIGQSHLMKNFIRNPVQKDSAHLDNYFKSYCILKMAPKSVFNTIFFNRKKTGGRRPGQTDLWVQGDPHVSDPLTRARREGLGFHPRRLTGGDSGGVRPRGGSARAATASARRGGARGAGGASGGGPQWQREAWLRGNGSAGSPAAFQATPGIGEGLGM